jgi:hypothetical protein
MKDLSLGVTGGKVVRTCHQPIAMRFNFSKEDIQLASTSAPA